jgi:hypothetical protein
VSSDPTSHYSVAATPGPGEHAVRLIAEHGDPVGAAVEILSARHHLLAEEAEELLTQAGDARHKPIEDVAEDVILNGVAHLPAQIEFRTARLGESEVTSALLRLLARCNGVDDVLQGIVDLAVELCSVEVMTSLSLMSGDTVFTAACSDDKAAQMDADQYLDADSPVSAAAIKGVPTRVDLVSADSGPVWPKTARRCGVTTVVSLPVTTPARIRAALNVYFLAPLEDQVDPDVVETLAAHAWEAVTAACRLSGDTDDFSRGPGRHT